MNQFFSNGFLTCPNFHTPYLSQQQSYKDDNQQLKNRIKLLMKKIPETGLKQDQSLNFGQTLMSLSFKLKQKTLPHQDYKRIAHQVKIFQKLSNTFKDSFQCSSMHQIKTKSRFKQTNINKSKNINYDQIYKKAIEEQIQYRKSKDKINQENVKEKIQKQLKRKLEKTKLLNKRVQEIHNKNLSQQQSSLKLYMTNLSQKTPTIVQKKTNKSVENSHCVNSNLYHQAKINSIQPSQTTTLKKIFSQFQTTHHLNFINQNCKNNVISTKQISPQINQVKNQLKEKKKYQKTKLRRIKEKKQHIDKQNQSKKLTNLIKKEEKILNINHQHQQKKKIAKRQSITNHKSNQFEYHQEISDQQILNKIQDKLKKRQQYLENKVNKIKQALKAEQKRRQYHKFNMSLNQFVKTQQLEFKQTHFSSTPKQNIQQNIQQLKIQQRHKNIIKKQQMRSKINKLRQVSTNQLQKQLLLVINKLNQTNTNNNFY